MAVHEVLADAAGELFAQVVRRYAVEPVDQRGDREFRGVADEQADVVVVAVELPEFDAATPTDIRVLVPSVAT